MDVTIWTKSGKKLVTYDSEVEGPKAAVMLMSRVARHREEWVRIGAVVIWSGNIDAIHFAELDEDDADD